MNTAVIIFTQCTYSIILRQSYKFNVCDRFFIQYIHVEEEYTTKLSRLCTLEFPHFKKEKNLYTYMTKPKVMHRFVLLQSSCMMYLLRLHARGTLIKNETIHTIIHEKLAQQIEICSRHRRSCLC